jgi:hypothetical protein
MFIICPKCSAKYQIPEGITLQEGQKLKCSACDFIFLKGEESPLVLEQPIIQKTTEPTTEAFSTPLYTHTDSVKQPTPATATSLPEAFQPITNPTKSKSYLWFIPIYIILIIALCMLGWHFRDSIRPTIQEVIPEKTIKQETIPEGIKTKTEKKQELKTNTLSVGTQKERKHNVIQPVQEKKIKDTIETKPLPISNPSKQPIKETQSKENELLPQPEMSPDSVITPEKNVDTSTLLQEDIIPLFDAVAMPIPTAKEQELEVIQISFRIEPSEQGIEQLLVEGNLQNKSAEVRSVPSLTVLLLDKDKNVLNRKKIHVDNEQLNPSQILPFYTGISPVPAGVDHVDVQF